MKVKNIMSGWLFNVLGGSFIENKTLYVGRAEAAAAQLNLEEGDVAEKQLNVAGISITDGRVFPVASLAEVKTPYVVYDSIDVQYERTKDGSYPSGATARVLCVDKTYSGAEALADKAEALLADQFVAPLNGECLVTSRGSDYDANTGDFFESIRIRVEL